ncbi:MAG TPA: ATP-binding protein [Bryobacteraceae bacterium]|nr:ATP-binding protein [Bryobacteraceae bacterium]
MPSGDIYARIFRNAQTGLLLLEKDTGRILEANAAFLQMAGRSRAEVVGRSFWEPPLAADADAAAEIRGHLLAGRAVTGAESPLLAGDGRRLLLEVSGSAAGGLIQLEVRDATGREQARLAERIEVLRSLAGRTAVEFQNVHRALRAMGELLLIGAGQGRPVLDELEEVQRASERASTIAEQLLAFSGGTALRIQPVALNDLVEGMLPRLRQLFGPDIEIVLDLCPDMPPVMADAAQMQHIVLRLAANSRDAMGRRGAFSLQTANQPTVEPGLGRTGAAGGPYGMLAVSDSGPGLDDQSWAHLYEPFFSTKTTGGGLGLGLAAVYGIVRQSGGRLWAYSQPGKGATFRIYLPFAGAQSLVGAQFPAPPPPPLDRSPGDATILLVEAHDGMRTVMANVLKKRGYRVLAAIHSKEALRVTKAQGPPDLLISRPNPELAMRLARLQPQLRVLYLGGSADAQDQELPPRTAILQKPFEPQTLLAAVLRLLSQPL